MHAPARIAGHLLQSDTFRHSVRSFIHSFIHSFIPSGSLTSCQEQLASGLSLST